MLDKLTKSLHISILNVRIVALLRLARAARSAARCELLFKTGNNIGLLRATTAGLIFDRFLGVFHYFSKPATNDQVGVIPLSC